jgi:hypothetical protein
MARSLRAAEQTTGAALDGSRSCSWKLALGASSIHTHIPNAAPNLLLAHPNMLAGTLKAISCTISQSRTYGFGAALSLKFQSYWPDYLLHKPCSNWQSGRRKYFWCRRRRVRSALAHPPPSLMNYSPRHGTIAGAKFVADVCML